MTGIVAVTGAAGALGSKTVDILVAAGWKVVGIDLADFSNDKLALAIGGVNLTDEASVASAAAKIKTELGNLDALVNIAGGFVWETVEGGSVASWEKMFALNVKTALTASLAMLPLLKDANGSIVNVSANATAKAGMGMGAYTASKSGVSRLTEALAEEHKGTLRVNAIMPSIIDTEANRADMPDADFSEWVTAEELANVISFLISPAASGVTGALVPVTGRV